MSITKKKNELNEKNKMDKKIFSALFFSIFASVTGVGVVVPLLPIYAHDLGASGLYIGMIFGSFSLSRTFFLPYFGRLSDKKGRKSYILAGLFAYFIISIGFIFSKNVESLIIIRFIHGIASAMIMPVVQAYVGDITPKGREGFVMGLFNMAMFSGLSIGPLIGGIINDHFSLQYTFVCMGFLSLTGFFLSLYLLPPTRLENAAFKRPSPPAWGKLINDKMIAGLFFFRFGYTAGIGIIWGFLPVLAGVELELSASSIGFLVMLGVFASGSLQMPMGLLADRINRTWMVITGGLIVVVAMASFEWATGFNHLVIVNLVFGFGGGIAMPALMAITIQKGKKSGAMGSVMALLTVGHSFGMFVGSTLAGLMMDFFELRHAFALGSVIMAVCTGFFIICTFTKSKESAKMAGPH